MKNNLTLVTQNGTSLFTLKGSHISNKKIPVIRVFQKDELLAAKISNKQTHNILKQQQCSID